MSYRICFPKTEDKKKRIAIFPEESGYVHNSWWHPHLEHRFNSALDALAFAEEILNARKRKKECPCGTDCAIKAEAGGTVFEEDEREEIHLD